MASKRLVRRSVRIAKDNLQTAADSAVTIAARVQALGSPAGAQAEKAREARVMVEEKVHAAVDGAWAAQAAWGAFWVKAAFGGVRTPADVAVGLADIAIAATAPARRKAQANARRLTRKAPV